MTLLDRRSPARAGPRVWVLATLTLLGLAPAPQPPHPLDGPDVELAMRLGARQAQLVLRANGVAVEALAGLPGEDPRGLDPAWAEALAARLVAERGGPAGGLAVSVDGTASAPRLQRARIEPATPEQAALFPNFGARAAALLEIELSLPRPLLAQHVEVRWGRFPSSAIDGLALPGAVPLILRAGAKRQRAELTPQAPSLRWALPTDTAPILETIHAPPLPRGTRASRYLRLAALGAIAAVYLAWLTLHGRRGAALLAAVGTLFLGAAAARPLAAPIEEDQACAVFAALQRNLYASFDSVERDGIYDSLAQCVDGALLEDIYGQVERSLLVTDHGGAQGRVETLDLVTARCLERGTTGAGSAWFRVEATWRVQAVVEHSGHAHRRLEEYAARFDVLAQQDGWRIHAQDLLRQERLEEPQAG